MNKKFSILITTKNRKDDLVYTLLKINSLLDRNDVECIICDDGSTDGTSEVIRENYPNITLIRHDKSKGYIYNRNLMLNLSKAEYSISLDDDANFLSEKPLEFIVDFFSKNQQCGLIALRIFWGKKSPEEMTTVEKALKVKGFVGCGHVWNMKAWKAIRNYPDWFVFYGEEDFAAFELFKKGWEIYYLPEVLIHHRVDISARKKDKDYQIRLRRSLRSGWYLYLLFYPWGHIPRKLAYTLWRQIKLKVFKGDWKASLGILQAIADVIINLPRLIKHSNRFSVKEFQEFSKLPDTKVYWNQNK